MADQEQVERLKHSVEEWNTWRQQHSEIRPDFNDANLIGANLGGADLSSANLIDANLGGATLYRADLSNADLTGATLNFAELFFANLTGADLTGKEGGSINRPSFPFASTMLSSPLPSSGPRSCAETSISAILPAGKSAITTARCSIRYGATFRRVVQKSNGD
jgi:uncharacterized protein YjbI with pentapeptide repeats